LSLDVVSKLSNSYTQASALPVVRGARARGTASPVVRWAIAGLVAGVTLGLLTRPSVPLIGQLPIETVLTRGANLSGMDLLLKSTAEQSFNQVLVVAIIGAVAGTLVGAYLGHQKQMLAAATAELPMSSAAAAAGATIDATRGQAEELPMAFCIACGTKLPDVAAFCPKCEARRAA
jgi:small basic protein